MRRTIKNLVGLFFILSVLVLFFSCMQPFSQTDGKGKLAISIPSGAKTIQPDNIEIASYVLSGSGPNSATLSNEAFTTSPHTVSDLAAGSWTFTVQGKNSAGVVVASGSVTGTIVVNSTTNVSVTLTPLNVGVGTGTFSISGTVPAGVTMTGTISPKSGGSDIPFTVTVSGTSLSYSNSTLLASSNYEVTLHAETSDGKEWNNIYALRVYDDMDSPLTLNLSTSDFIEVAAAAAISVDPSSVTSGTVNTQYSFTLTATNIPTGVSQVTFSYNFGDGSGTATGSTTGTVSNHTASATISHTYTSSSAYGLVVTVSDGSTTLASGYASIVIGTVNSGNDYDLTVLNSWVAANSGGYGITQDTWDISMLPSGCVFDIDFDAYSMPDKFIIEYPDGTNVLDTGWRGDSYYNNSATYPGGIAGQGAGEEDGIFAKSSQSYFKITIIGGEPGTAWEYSIRARQP